MDLPLSALRAVRAVAESRSFTAAATAHGYTQSAMSRQIAAVERELGATLFERTPRGVRPTAAGEIVLRRVVIALEALEQAEKDLEAEPRRVRRVRLGAVSVAGVALLPRSLAALRRTDADLEIISREGTTPALVRAVRAGTLDAAVITARPPFRSPDQERPSLEQHMIADATLALAVPTASRHAGPEPVTVTSLEGESWIASRSTVEEPQLGVWPGVPGRPAVRHWTRDWATKLALVAEGAGVTTVPADLLPTAPLGVTVTRIEGLPAEVRRVILAHAAGLDPAVAEPIVRALRATAVALVAERRARP